MPLFKRINDNDKPLNTVQDKLTKEDINDLLKNYVRVSSYHELKKDMRIRYFIISDTKKLFRTGGTITVIDLEKKYIVLVQNNITWSVQLNKNIILYREANIEDIKTEYMNEINKLKKDIHEMGELCTQLKNENKILVDKKNNYKNKLLSINKMLDKLSK